MLYRLNLHTRNGDSFDMYVQKVLDMIRLIYAGVITVNNDISSKHRRIMILSRPSTHIQLSIVC
jgi:hypothetical protein